MKMITGTNKLLFTGGSMSSWNTCQRVETAVLLHTALCVSVPVPVTPQQGQFPAPQSPALPSQHWFMSQPSLSLALSPGRWPKPGAGAIPVSPGCPVPGWGRNRLPGSSLTPHGDHPLLPASRQHTRYLTE